MPHFSYGDPHPDKVDIGARMRDARFRLAVHLADTLARADRLFLQGSQGVLDGLALFDRDATNILATHRSLAEGVGAEPRLAGPLRDFANLSVNILRLRVEAGARMAWHRAAIRACQLLGDSRGEGRAIGNIGIAHFDLAEYGPALESFRRHLDIARAVGDAQGQANAHSNVGSSLLRTGRPGEALAHFKEYLRLARETGDRIAEEKALCNLGVLYETQGDPSRALAYQEASARVAREVGDRMGEARALNNMSGVFNDLGEPDNAIRCLTASLGIVRELGYRLGEANNLGNLGNAYARLGKWRAALDCHAEQLRIAREIRDRRGEGNSLWNMALAKSSLGETDAAAYARAALAIYTAIGHELAPQVRTWLLLRPAAGPPLPSPLLEAAPHEVRGNRLFRFAGLFLGLFGRTARKLRWEPPSPGARGGLPAE